MSFYIYKLVKFILLSVAHMNPHINIGTCLIPILITIVRAIQIETVKGFPN